MGYGGLGFRVYSLEYLIFYVNGNPKDSRGCRAKLGDSRARGLGPIGP